MGGGKIVWCAVTVNFIRLVDFHETVRVLYNSTQKE